VRTRAAISETGSLFLWIDGNTDPVRTKRFRGPGNDFDGRTRRFIVGDEDFGFTSGSLGLLTRMKDASAKIRGRFRSAGPFRRGCRKIVGDRRLASGRSRFGLDRRRRTRNA